jgi:hypothetical protein
MSIYYFGAIASQSCPSRIFAFLKSPANTSSMTDVKIRTAAYTAIPAKSASLCAHTCQWSTERVTLPSRSPTTNHSHRWAPYDRKISTPDMDLHRSTIAILTCQLACICATASKVTRAQPSVLTSRGDGRSTVSGRTSIASTDVPSESFESITFDGQPIGVFPWFEADWAPTPDCRGERYRIMWTGHIHSEFFRLTGGASARGQPFIEVQEGYTTSTLQVSVNADWIAQAEEVGMYIVDKTTDRDLVARWFESPGGHKRSVFARLVEAAAIKGIRGRRFREEARTVANSVNSIRLNPSNAALPETLQPREQDTLKVRLSARHEGVKLMKALVQTYRVPAEGSQTRPHPDSLQIDTTLRRALTHFHKAYHFWRYYGNPGLAGEARGERG